MNHGGAQQTWDVTMAMSIFYIQTVDIMKA